ncbi:hypothetical protein, partial [Streptomyces sp. NPDC096030]|uniref:hypothetical protein n=1 Tax=Streptomyces sp. NPDC096030 TaxID=3155423 RepID=UPI00332513D3
MVKRICAAVAAAMLCLAAAGTARAAAGPAAPGAWQGTAGHMREAQEPLAFLDMAGAAVARVQAQYPEAYLLEGQGTSPGGATTDPADFTDWLFLFRLEGQRHAAIRATTGGTFSAPVVLDRPWLGDQIICWTPQEFLSLGEADRLLKQAGHTGAYETITFREPLYRDDAQPYYIFGFVTLCSPLLAPATAQSFRFRKSDPVLRARGFDVAPGWVPVGFTVPAAP